MDRRTKLLLILFGVFLTSAVTAELISSKLFMAHVIVPYYWGKLDLGSYVSIVGIIPWPVVFLVTDTINEFYGAKVLRSISFITAFMIAFCFIIVFIAMQPSAFVPSPPVPVPAGWKPGVANDEQFNTVFGQSLWIIIGSITAFIIGQLIDSVVFWSLRKRTGGKLIWLRSTGSTVISQFVDTFVVLYIGLVVPGTIKLADYWGMGMTNYLFKLMIAVALTPLIYLGHWLVEKYLGKEKAHLIEEKVAAESEKNVI